MSHQRVILSIIIPTLNEEYHLPLLLDSVSKQNLDNYEMIVVDAGSTDRTLEVATSYNCKVVAGDLPARGRNEGAKVAQGELLLFLDADIVLRENSLKRALEEFECKGLDVSSFCLEPQTGARITKFLFNLFYNWPILLCESILPHAAQAILAKRTIHEKSGGFDEKVRLGEDHDYVRRSRAIGKFGILQSSRILSSTRRFEEDGWLKTYLKYLFAELHMIIFGSVKSDIFRYKFDHYGTRKRKLERRRTGSLSLKLKALKLIGRTTS